MACGPNSCVEPSPLECTVCGGGRNYLSFQKEEINIAWNVARM